jgi:hypothetical protein
VFCGQVPQAHRRDGVCGPATVPLAIRQIGMSYLPRVDLGVRVLRFGMLVMRRNFIAQIFSFHADIVGIGKFLQGFEFSIKKFNLLLLFVNHLVKLFNQILGETQFDFQIGNSFICRHVLFRS